MAIVGNSVDSPKRREDIVYMAPPDSVGVELGVAAGGFSERLLATGHLQFLYGVDRYTDHHDFEEYLRALRRFEKRPEEYQLMRRSFEDAAENFTDEYFGFIYIDGYAHTGQDGGQTMETYWPKLRTGGLFAGDDYCKKWKHNKRAVDKFAAQVERVVSVFDWDRTEKGDQYSQAPSWYFYK